MLARMDGDETMVKLIQSLSRMLRISISKGENDVSLKDELEHVKCYLNIEQIRNENLFQYEIEVEESILQVKIPKIILQPVVENCIKYGFADMDKGGRIKVDVRPRMVLWFCRSAITAASWSRISWRSLTICSTRAWRI